MIEFGGNIYYIDFKNLDKVLTSGSGPSTEETITKEIKTDLDGDGKPMHSQITTFATPKGKEVDFPKYEMIKYMVEILLEFVEDDEETDFTLGIDRVLSKRPLSYQIAFNTLMANGILKAK